MSYKNLRAYAVIPARGGSKRIPRKNIKEFHGKPIIAYSIQTAIESKLFEEVIVSTDDSEIAEIAESYGALAPFRRPESLSGDYASSFGVIAHSVQWLIDNDCSPTHVCCIYPTAPFLKKDFLEEGFTLLINERLDFVFSVTSFPYPIQRALRVDNGLVTMKDPSFQLARSQDLEEFYHDAGQFYFGSSDAFISKSSIFEAQTGCIKLPRETVHDIDNPEDWKIAEKMFIACNSI